MIVSILLINILLFSYFITEHTGAFTNVFNETGGFFTHSAADTLISSANNIIYTPNLFSNLGPFETYNPNLDVGHSIGITGSEESSVTIFSTNNTNYFFSNAFSAIGVHSSH